MKKIFQKKEFNILCIVIALSILITTRNSVFISPDNLIDLLKCNTVLGILGMGMLMAIITGGIDVSVGAMTAVITIIIGKILVAYQVNILFIFLIASLCGFILGAINGFFISKLNIPPIIVTLGTLSIYGGLNLYYTNGNWITNLPKYFLDFGNIRIIGLPIQIFFLIGVMLLTHFLLNYTLFGRGIYCIGGNSEAASRAGYKKEKILFFLYSYIGFIAGIAAVVHTTIVKMVDPNAFSGFEIMVIAVVVLGGANILGGEGSVVGTLFGLILLGVINNGLILAWVSTYWQQIIVGAIILASVSFDVIQSKRIEKEMFKIDVKE
jgi:ribose/xylose/arabinose/galactoside ABC-type transport system permease subunit